MVIGAHGMLGTDLVELLENSAEDVIALDLDDIDIRRPDSAMEVLGRFRPARVFNVAAMTDVDGCETNVNEAFEVNARGPEYLAQGCRGTGAVLVHISTDYVFDGRKNSPYSEGDALRPLGVYGRSKAEGEIAVRSALPDRHLIVRTQWLFGLHGKNFVEAILRQAKVKDSLRVVEDQKGRPTYTRDLAAALINLARKGALGTVHVTNVGTTSWYGFAGKIIELAGIRGVRVEPMLSIELDRKAPRPLYSVLDSSKFREITGCALPHWEEALQDYLARRGDLEPY